MKKVSLKKIATMLLLTTAIMSCASSLHLLPSLENRTLRINVEKAGFIYQYSKCNGKWWPLRKCWIEKIEYDFTDRELRSKLKNMGFMLKVVK